MAAVCKRRHDMIMAGTRILTPEEVYQHLIKPVQRKAKTRGLELDKACFNQVRTQIETQEVCPMIGVPFDWREGNKLPFRHSLDRVDNTKGYVPGNVLVVSNWWNKAKYMWPAETSVHAIRCAAENFERMEAGTRDKNQMYLDGLDLVGFDHVNGV